MGWSIGFVQHIFKILGRPSEKMWPDFVNLPGVKWNFVGQPHNKLREKFPAISFAGRPMLSESGFDLLNGLLTYDPQKRITAEKALEHDWFQEVPLPKMKELMPTFPVRSEHDRRLKSSDPLEELRELELRQGCILSEKQLRSAHTWSGGVACPHKSDSHAHVWADTQAKGLINIFKKKLNCCNLNCEGFFAARVLRRTIHLSELNLFSIFAS
ncbi:hypothetical protein O6H91_16G011900 [Diphasiastrum complanatum]|uniref:Uncharacterized protein n=1 Tax=Diphasiastrum complanatum TaxID=34168 RepID=A0ACC2BA01_DIPCM|nr:hypothetical protein O6H91_16G011900 [Diphasiastrum complanatum]